MELRWLFKGTIVSSVWSSHLWFLNIWYALIRSANILIASPWNFYGSWMEGLSSRAILISFNFGQIFVLVWIFASDQSSASTHSSASAHYLVLIITVFIFNEWKLYNEEFYFQYIRWFTVYKNFANVSFTIHKFSLLLCSMGHSSQTIRNSSWLMDHK